MANTTWSATDKTANVTLTGSNLIATSTNASIAGVRAVDKQTAGKFYWEYTVNTLVGTNTQIGIADGFINLTISPSVFGSSFVRKDGTIVVNGVTIINVGGSLTSGTVLCVALDLTARLVWYRLGAAGNWNNSGTANPATAAGGIACTGFGGAFAAYPCASFQTGSDQFTANFGDSAFTGTPPSGFTAGFTAGATSTTSALATQVAVEEWASVAAAVASTQGAIAMVLA